MQPTFAIVFFLVTAIPRGQALNTGQGIAGCVTDRMGQPIPRVTISINGGGVARRVVTNGGGCYEAADVPPGTYELIGRTPGFVTAVFEDIRVERGLTTKLGFQMQIASIIDYVNSDFPLSTLWEKADAVVHLRIAAHQTGTYIEPGMSSIRHVATVLEAFKRHPKAGPTGSAMTFLQDLTTDEPFAIGSEFVLFLRWDTFLLEDSFRMLMGPMVVFAVENGKIKRGLSPTVNRYEGASLDTLLGELRDLAAHR